MTKSANINIRIDPETKAGAERVFSDFGLSMSDAIGMFLRKSILEGGLPFDLKSAEHISPRASVRI